MSGNAPRASVCRAGTKILIGRGWLKPFNASLNFEKAGAVDVEFAVEAVGGTPTAMLEHGAHHH